MKFKKLGIYLLFLLPWFLSAILFRSDSSYYQSLNLPFIAPPPFIFAIVWPILYFLLAYSIYHVWQDKDSNYQNSLIVNYLSNQLFSFFFFTIKSNLLAFLDTIIVLISSIYLYRNTKAINQNYSKYLIPYIIWNIFAFVLIFLVFAMN